MISREHVHGAGAHALWIIKKPTGAYLHRYACMVHLKQAVASRGTACHGKTQGPAPGLHTVATPNIGNSTDTY